MRTLVTGASGFIGRHVIEQLAQTDSHDLVAVSRKPNLHRIKNVRYEVADLLMPDSASSLIERFRPTHLLHLAWNAEPGFFWNAPNNLDWSSATLALVSAFIRNGGKRAVVSGSCAEYDWCGDGRLSEDGVINPATFYGCAKDATRRAICAAGEAAGIPIGWARIFWLYGPHEPAGRLVSDVSTALLQGKSIDTTMGYQRRDFLHVDDVAGALVASMYSDYHGPFNIGSGQAVSIRDLIGCLAEQLGRSSLVKFGAKPSSPNEPPILEASTAILSNEIGYKPKFDLRDGLLNTSRWWQDRLSPMNSI